jgi:CelD/BcsL family acetyltransferase involved in cellulose biosynthesis
MLRDKRVAAKTISSSRQLLEIETEWNEFIIAHSENPFLLSEFLKLYMDQNQLKGRTPLLLVLSIDRTIVGVATLMIQKRFGFRVATTVLKPEFSPGLIFLDECQEECIIKVLDFIFREMNCQFAHITLPAESPDVTVLQQTANIKRIHQLTMPESNHCVLPVDRSWEEFERIRGSDFRREFRIIERNMNRIGLWKTERVELGSTESDTFDKILKIEKMSWKEADRKQRGQERDKSLLTIWQGSLQMVRSKQI